MENRISKWILIIGFSSIIIYAVYDNIMRHYAMQDTTIVKAKIIDVWSHRGGRSATVRFRFNDKNIEREVGVDHRSLKPGDTVLIKVSNDEPYEYHEFVRALKPQTADSTKYQ